MATKISELPAVESPQESDYLLINQESTTSIILLSDFVDAEPTEDSVKPAQSGGVYTALETLNESISGKQDALTFDDTPTEDSTNLVTSGGVYDALKTSGVQSDWDERDSTASDYINNRPFYSEPVFSDLQLCGHSLNDNTGELVISDTSVSEISTPVKETGYPSASQDGTMPWVATLILEYYSKSKYPSSFPTDLDTSVEYQVYLDDELIYKGTPGSTAVGFWESSDEWISGSYKVLGSAADGIMIYTELYSEYSTVALFSEWKLYTRGVKWYFFLPAETAAESHTITLKYESGETVTQIPLKYIPVADSAASGNENPVTSAAVYSALAKKQNRLTFDSEPNRSSSNPVTSAGIYSAIETVTSAISDLEDTISALESRISDLESAMEEKDDEISSLESRVTYLESLHSGDSEDSGTANVSDGTLVLDGDSVDVDEDGCLSFASSDVTVDDSGILSVEATAGSTTVDDGTLTVSGAEVDSDGSLTMSGSATVDDGTLTV